MGKLGSFSSSAMSKLDINSVGLKLAVSSGVGGTSSALTGGSFANGAITGAFTTIFNHAMHDGGDIPEHDDYSRYKKSGKLITSGRADALEFMIGAAKSSRVEVSMFLLEDGSYFVNPWDGNNAANSQNTTISFMGKNFFYEKETGKRFIAQYHYGPTLNKVSSIGSYNDRRCSLKWGVAVYHIGEENTYAYPKPALTGIINSHNPTIIPTNDFLNQKGKTIIFEHKNNCL